MKKGDTVSFNRESFTVTNVKHRPTLGDTLLELNRKILVSDKLCTLLKEVTREKVVQMRLDMLAVIVKTDSPCREKCWNATGNVCRCSCGGVGHGKNYDVFTDT